MKTWTVWAILGGAPKTAVSTVPACACAMRPQKIAIAAVCTRIFPRFRPFLLALAADTIVSGPQKSAPYGAGGQARRGAPFSGFEDGMTSVEKPLIVVMGVAGSGKTTIAKAGLAEHLGVPFVEGDLHPIANVKKMSAGIPLTDDDRRPGWKPSARAWKWNATPATAWWVMSWPRRSSTPIATACAQAGAWQSAVHPAGRFARADRRPQLKSARAILCLTALLAPVRHPGKAHRR
ncbi:MAG: gluconokinase [Alphaproteobacteria bacterium]